MTTTTRQEIDELFSMFHDFEIVLMTYDKGTLDLTIRIPWGELWDDLDYKIKVTLSGCAFIHCDYYEVINTPDNLSKNWVDRAAADKSTNDPKIISELGLEVQSHNYYSPNKYEFLCNSGSENCQGGKLTFTADNYKIFNNDGVQIDLKQIKKWSTDWWNSIQKI